MKQIHRQTVLIFILIFLIVATFLTSRLVQKRQEIRKEAASMTSIYFEPAEKTGFVGKTVELGIFTNTQENTLYSVLLEITFDPSSLEAQTLTSTNLFPDIISPPSISYGKITLSAGVGFSGSFGNPPVSGTKKIASVFFKILKPSTGTTVSFGSQTSAYTGIGSDIGVNLIKTTTPATVIGLAPPTPTPKPTATPTPKPTNTPTPTPTPTATPTLKPTSTPTPKPTATPTPTPTATPTPSPTATPTLKPTSTPSPTPEPTQPPKVGDITGDGKVDEADYAVLIANFGKLGDRTKGDLTGDGKIDEVDYAILMANFGK